MSDAPLSGRASAGWCTTLLRLLDLLAGAMMTGICN